MAVSPARVKSLQKIAKKRKLPFMKISSVTGEGIPELKQAMWDAGLKLPTQVADGRSTCFCGAAIGIADVEQHVLAAHMEQVGC